MELLKSKFRPGGRFVLECLRLMDPETGLRFRDKGGRFLPRQLAWTEDVHNIITNEGLDSILDVYFHAATQITTWYCLLFEDDVTPAAGTTYAVPVFTETTAYDEATRPEYEEAAASSQSITNAANKATFTISASKTLYGAAIVGGGSAATTKDDQAGGGTMPAAAKFSSSRAVVDDDVVNLTYQIDADDDGA